MSILDFLGYQQIIIFPNNCSEMKKHLIEQKNEEYNLKLDRIYHNIISAGNHPETNRETIIKKIKRENSFKLTLKYHKITDLVTPLFVREPALNIIVSYL